MAKERDPRSTSGKSAMLVSSSLAAVSLAIWWRSLASSLALGWRDDRYTHILLILPISMVLLILDWDADACPDRSKAFIGGTFLVVAASITAWARWRSGILSSDIELSINMLGLVLWWVGAFSIGFGMKALRRALFPLLFLLWIVPLPEFAVNAVIRWLQQGSAAAAHFLFSVVGVPVERQGTLLSISGRVIPDLIMEVAPECSSIRSSSILLVITMVLAHLLLRSRWRKLLVVAVALPLSVAKNGLRIFTIGFLATRVDPSFLTGRLHRQGGITFLLAALAAVIALIWILRWTEAGETVLERRKHPAESPRSIARRPNLR